MIIGDVALVFHRWSYLLLVYRDFELEGHVRPGDVPALRVFVVRDWVVLKFCICEACHIRNKIDESILVQSDHLVRDLWLTQCEVISVA